AADRRAARRTRRMNLAIRGSVEHRLDVTGALVDAALATGAASEVLDELANPIAVFASLAARPANAAWRVLFADHALPAAIIARIAEVAETGTLASEDELLLDGDGPPAYVSLVLRRRREATGVIAICEDCTELVIARQLDAPADALLWGGPVGGAADYFNTSWVRYAETRTTWQSAVHPADLARCTRALDDAAKYRAGLDVEARLRRHDGSFDWYVVRFVPPNRASAGRRWYASATPLATDRGQLDRVEQLAEAQAARTDAEQASALKDQFLAAVSHELRAPLTTILLWEKILRTSAADGLLHVQAIDAIHQSALVQGRLVDDLLDVSRAISGKLHVDLDPIDVEAVIASALGAIAPSALAKQITLERRGPPVSELVLGDPERIRQILGNLLANAVKFSEPLGRVSIAVASEHDQVAIAVEDTGRGIAPEFVQHLFIPFSQSEEAVTSGAGGLGLGLAIAKQLAVLHGGGISARSAGLGQGATFTLTLPCVGRRTAAAKPPPRRASLPRVHVLVVDDDWRVREALALLLERAGAIVETAESAAIARAKMAAQMPAVLVSDIAMPGENGYQFLQQLRAGGCAVPAIALTAHATRSDIERARAAGYEIHLAKPVDFDKLVARIDELANVAQIA
ncbi:MAG TPA: ATP-binding protein, partial [Kofleriaceae bacterium]|nr:ATP-binding protein [Kofleriaceae bacterium]